MKTWIGAFSIASTLFLAFACSDDDKKISDNEGGAGGEAGSPAETGGTHTGGINGGGAGGVDGGAGGGDVGGAGGAPITCEPPEPPGGSSDNAGGAGGAAGASGSGGAAGSGGEAGAAVASGLAIEGSYVDNFMGEHTVTSSTWTSGGSIYHIASFSNAAHFIVARNDQANMWSPCLWSRFDWTVAAGELYFCMTAYAAASEEAARATPAADASDPATTGCGTFAWSKLTPE